MNVFIMEFMKKHLGIKEYKVFEQESLNSAAVLRSLNCAKKPECYECKYAPFLMNFFDKDISSLHSIYYYDDLVILNNEPIEDDVDNLKPFFTKFIKECFPEETMGLLVVKPTQQDFQKNYVFVFAIGEQLKKKKIRVLCSIARIFSDRLMNRLYNEELRKVYNQISAQYKHIPIPTYTWQYDGNDFKLANFNDAAIAITGGRIKSCYGLKLNELYRDYLSLQLFVYNCYEQKKPQQLKLNYDFTGTGYPRKVSVVFGYVPPNQVIVHKEDISQNIELKKNLEEVNERIETKNTAMEELLQSRGKIKDDIQVEVVKKIDHVFMPLISSIKATEDENVKKLAELLEGELTDIAAEMNPDIQRIYSKLTEREKEILIYVQCGLNTKQICDILRIAVKSVERHRYNIRKKLKLTKKGMSLQTYLNNLKS